MMHSVYCRIYLGTVKRINISLSTNRICTSRMQCHCLRTDFATCWLPKRLSMITWGLKLIVSNGQSFRKLNPTGAFLRSERLMTDAWQVAWQILLRNDLKRCSKRNNLLAQTCYLIYQRSTGRQKKVKRVLDASQKLNFRGSFLI